jgi:hypothetical protein
MSYNNPHVPPYQRKRDWVETSLLVASPEQAFKRLKVSTSPKASDPGCIDGNGSNTALQSLPLPLIRRSVSSENELAAHGQGAYTHAHHAQYNHQYNHNSSSNNYHHNTVQAQQQEHVTILPVYPEYSNVNSILGQLHQERRMREQASHWTDTPVQAYAKHNGQQPMQEYAAMPAPANKPHRKVKHLYTSSNLG